MSSTKYRAWDGKIMHPWESMSVLYEPGMELSCPGVKTLKEPPHIHFKKLFDDLGHANIILLQDSGIKDKHGVALYEKDVIRGKFKNDKKGVELIEIAPFIIPTGFHWYSELEDMEFEIIGDVYRWPELIEQAKNK